MLMDDRARQGFVWHPFPGCKSLQSHDGFQIKIRLYHLLHCRMSRISSRETPLWLETERKTALRVPIRKLSCAGMEIRRSGCIKKESIDGFPHIVAQLVPGVCLCKNTFRKTFGDKAPISFLCDLKHQFSHSTPLPCMVMKCTCRDKGASSPAPRPPPHATSGQVLRCP
jgi:hypothetical protein